MIKRICLIILLAATFNLSLHTNYNDTELDEIGVYFDQPNLSLLPFTNHENSKPVTFSDNVHLITFSKITDSWSTISNALIHLKIFIKHNSHQFKEYPFIILIRVLRI